MYIYIYIYLKHELDKGMRENMAENVYSVATAML